MRTIHSLNQDWTFIKAEHPADVPGVPVTLPPHLERRGRPGRR